MAELKVVSVGLRGNYGRDLLERGLQQLKDWLAEHPEWESTGTPRILGYNSPFVPNLFKYAEVQIPVTAKP